MRKLFFAALISLAACNDPENTNTVKKYDCHETEMVLTKKITNPETGSHYLVFTFETNQYQEFVTQGKYDSAKLGTVKTGVICLQVP